MHLEHAREPTGQEGFRGGQRGGGKLRKETNELYSRVAASQHLEADDPQTRSNQSARTGLRAGVAQGHTDAGSAGCAGDEAEEDGLRTWEAGGSAAATRGCLVPDVTAEQDTAGPADVQSQQSSGPSAGAVRRPHGDSRPVAPRLPSFWPSASDKANRVSERGLETAKRSLL